MVASPAMPPYILPMKLRDGSAIVADLTTIGRKSGQRRTVELRFVFLNGRFFASSSRVQGKHWCQNLLNHPAAELMIRGQKLSCTAKQVTDNELRRQILATRGSPSQLDRVVFELTPRDAAII
jgi:deazaflavin-dependent oxidoreductase (nitroreductase family)